jgi:hypothetical protein
MILQTLIIVCGCHQKVKKVMEEQNLMKNMATDKAVYKPAGTSDYREEDKRKSL